MKATDEEISDVADVPRDESVESGNMRFSTRFENVIGYVALTKKERQCLFTKRTLHKSSVLLANLQGAS